MTRWGNDEAGRLRDCCMDCFVVALLAMTGWEGLSGRGVTCDDEVKGNDEVEMLAGMPYGLR